ncbi:MAG TPA: alkaline phosphatase family protein, partial [Flavisolibacter sp.]|nr:alkaline phosphatase family protein [Flavisolibacter sp.]
MNEGFNCDNTLIPYTPTYTAPGHASVYTGSVPSLHGIAGNFWYDRKTHRSIYCTEDDSVQTVGSTGNAGKQSPKNLWANTISDELRLSTNFRNKTIAIALKDRGSILPGGHTASGVYWFDQGAGAFITSTFYMNTLPPWVTAFNAQKLPDASLKQSWKTLYPLNTYGQSTADAKPYEDVLPGEDNSFDHRTDTISAGKYTSFMYTPAANTYTFDMAKAAIKAEDLGKGVFTDLLAVSFSATDYAGHKFGPNSIEAEDMYLRFDRDLSLFLSYLDAAIGKDQYLLFLTADHGVAHVPGFNREHRLPGAAVDDALIGQQVNDSINKRFNLTNVIENVSNYQVYLNEAVLGGASVDRAVLKNFIIQKLLQHPGISHAFDLSTPGNFPLPEQVKSMVVSGYSQTRGGDIQFTFKPQWFDGYNKGTTHGVWNPYDAHIPLLWYGTGIRRGKLYREVYMTDIAPTLAALLGIQMPNAAIGKVIAELMPVPVNKVPGR